MKDWLKWIVILLVSATLFVFVGLVLKHFAII